MASFAPSRGAAPAAADATRMPLIDLLRAAGSSLILWHHLAYFGPLSDNALPIAGGLIVWLFDYSAMAVQVFLVLGGFVMTRTLCHQRWHTREALRFAAQRYVRLGVPMLATIVIAMAACAWARPWLDERTVGPPPTWDQFLSHVLLAPFVLGYDRLSAGVWYVCIDFQLGLLLIAGLLMRDTLCRRLHVLDASWRREIPWLLGWTLALLSLFYVNRDSAWEDWGLYFFASYFMGAIVSRALSAKHRPLGLWLYAAVIVVGLAIDWRPRLAVCLCTGLCLFLSGRLGVLEHWPRNRIVAWLGRISYSLFLIHFSVLVVVSALWVRLDWDGAVAGWIGMIAIYVLSLGAAALFYRWVEQPAIRLSRQISLGPAASLPFPLQPSPRPRSARVAESSGQPHVAG